MKLPPLPNVNSHGGAPLRGYYLALLAIRAQIERTLDLRDKSLKVIEHGAKLGKLDAKLKRLGVDPPADENAASRAETIIQAQLDVIETEGVLGSALRYYSDRVDDYHRRLRRAKPENLDRET